MVYSVAVKALSRGGIPVMSSGQVLKELGITKITLYKWLMLGKIRAKRHQIGTRTFLDFDPKEVGRVKGLLKKNPEKGKALLED